MNFDENRQEIPFRRGAPMIRTADLLTKLIVASALMILPIGSLRAQEAVSARLSYQAGALRQDIDLLRKSLSDLTDRVSPFLL